MTMDAVSLAGGETGAFMDDESGATRAMRTRVASPEELDFLKIQEQKKARNRIVMIAGGVLAVVLAVLIFRPKTPPPEESVDWPKDSKGVFQDAVVPAPSGGYKDGGLNLVFPGNPGWKKTPIPGGLILESKVGRNRDISIRMVYVEQRDPKFLSLTLRQVAQDAIQELIASEGRWNFEKISSGIFFFGRDNGIPFASAGYEREGKGSWFGVLSVFMNGPKRYIVRMEVPENERLKTEALTYSTDILNPSPQFLNTLWMPVPELPPSTIDKLLRDARREMQRKAPSTWPKVETLLRSLLTKAVLENRPKVEEEALQMLGQLRDNEKLWYNSQRLAWEAAWQRKNKAAQRSIQETTKAVFSNIYDKRYYRVRKWE
jgi:hypothetical protein